MLKSLNESGIRDVVGIVGLAHFFVAFFFNVTSFLRAGNLSVSKGD